MKYFDETLKILFKAKSIGYERLPDGTQLIGNVPHVAPKAFLHEVYSPLVTEEIRYLEKALARSLPKDFEEFLTAANGCYLFSGALSISGYRRVQKRTVMDSRQPFDIMTPNIDERPKDAKDSFLFFGFYNWDGSQLYIDAVTNSVFRCNSESVKPLNRWDSFGDALLSEVKRLSNLFDSNGREIDPNRATTPDH